MGEHMDIRESGIWRIWQLSALPTPGPVHPFHQAVLSYTAFHNKPVTFSNMFLLVL